jgi:hypothetical protein
MQKPEFRMQDIVLIPKRCSVQFIVVKFIPTGILRDSLATRGAFPFLLSGQANRAAFFLGQPIGVGFGLESTDAHH